MDHADDGDDDDVFVYMGGHQEVPRDVTHVRVHKSVKIIRARAFMHCRNLVSIAMHEMAWKLSKKRHFMSAPLSDE